MNDSALVALEGSELDLPPGAERIGVADDDEPAEVTFVLRAGQDGRRGSPAARFGPRLDDIHAVLGWAAGSDLVLEDVRPVARTITLSGPVGRWRALLGADLVRCSWQGSELRAQAGRLRVPADLAPALVGAFGLDTRPVGRHAPVTTAAEASIVSPLQLRSAYRLPPGLDGHGQSIGVISLGGHAERADLILGALRFGIPAPELAVVPVRGAPAAPSVARPSQPEDQALALDTQVPAMLATGAQIVVYAAPNTAQGLVHAVGYALDDRHHRPTVLLINWASAELDGLFPAALARSLDAMFAVAGAAGITVVAGTSLARSPRPRSRQPRVAHPASSPHALACADTEVVAGARGIESETPWRPAGAPHGAGQSKLFDAPAWQRGVRSQAAGKPSAGKTTAGKAAGRVVPDVCAHGAGSLVTVGGVPASLAGGGSGAAVWAATVALLNQRLERRLGLLAPLLYEARGARSWDPERGLGPPDGEALFRALRAARATD